MRGRRSFAQAEGGAVAVEFALIGLLLIALCVGVVEVGRGLFYRNEVAFVADRGARLVHMNPAVPDAAVIAQVRAAAIGLNPALITTTLGTTTIGGVPFRTIDVRYPVTLLVPLMPNRTITLRTTRRIPASA